MRRTLFTLLNGGPGHERGTAVVALLVNTLILVNVTAVVLESFDVLAQRYTGTFAWIERMSVIVFTAEYAARLLVGDLHYPESHKPIAILRYLVTPLALIDLLAILPFYLPFVVTFDLRALRVLRLARIARIAKLSMLSTAIETMKSAIAKRKAELSMTVLLTGITVVFSATLMYYIETPHQPQVFSDIPSSLWWAIATLTTVGYGDIYPVTALGRMLAAVIALAGIGLVALPTGILGSSFLEEFNARRTRNANKRRRLSRSEPRIIHTGRKRTHAKRGHIVYNEGRTNRKGGHR